MPLGTNSPAELIGVTFSPTVRPDSLSKLQSAGRGVVQSAYQVQVTRDGKTVWDSGQPTSSHSIIGISVTVRNRAL